MSINKQDQINQSYGYPSEQMSQSDRRVLEVANLYEPSNSSDWGVTPPTTIDGALDHVAAANTALVLHAVKAQYDRSSDAGSGSVDLGVTIPNNAVISRLVVHCLIANVGATGMDITVNGQNLATGLHDNAADSVEFGVTGPLLTSASSNVLMNITGTASAGKFNIFIEYYQSE